MDYAKYRYEQDKKSREARKKQKGGHLKEVRMRPGIGEHDLGIKMEHAKEFLAENNKVQVSIVFRGRENQHRDLGMVLADKVRIALLEVGDVEGRPTHFGNRLIMSIMPKKK